MICPNEQTHHQRMLHSQESLGSTKMHLNWGQSLQATALLWVKASDQREHWVVPDAQTTAATSGVEAVAIEHVQYTEVPLRFLNLPGSGMLYALPALRNQLRRFEPPAAITTPSH